MGAEAYMNMRSDEVSRRAVIFLKQPLDHGRHHVDECHAVGFKVAQNLLRIEVLAQDLRDPDGLVRRPHEVQPM